jgi:hypothetical protein
MASTLWESFTPPAGAFAPQRLAMRKGSRMIPAAGGRPSPAWVIAARAPQRRRTATSAALDEDGAVLAVRVEGRGGGGSGFNFDPLVHTLSTR